MKRFLLTLPLIMALSAAAHAEGPPERFVLSAGVHNFTDRDSNQRFNEIRAELRLPRYSFWGFHPWVGIELPAKGLGWYGAGIETDMHITDSWIVTFQTGVGYYENGRYDPPGTQFLPNSGMEFRHHLELAYELETGNRVGLSVGHMSNGDTDDHNPGINTMTVNFHIPVDLATIGRRTAQPVR